MSVVALHTDDLVMSPYNKKEYYGQIATFHCGNEVIDQCLKESNAHNVTTVLFLNAANNDELVGYCSYCCSSISLKEEEESEDSYDECYPAIEIKLFGIAKKYQNVPIQGDVSGIPVAAYILDFCVSTLFVEIINESIYANYIVLHALNEAIAFYEKNNFAIMESDKATTLIGRFSSGCVPMFMALPKHLLRR